MVNILLQWRKFLFPDKQTGNLNEHLFVKLWQTDNKNSCLTILSISIILLTMSQNMLSEIHRQLEEVDLRLPELEDDVDLMLPLRISFASPINVCNIWLSLSSSPLNSSERRVGSVKKNNKKMYVV